MQKSETSMLYADQTIEQFRAFTIVQPSLYDQG